jgi:hypothetical protein
MSPLPFGMSLFLMLKMKKMIRFMKDRLPS